MAWILGFRRHRIVSCYCYHSQNFICYITGANTQLIENSWSCMKRKTGARYSKKDNDVTLIFTEYHFKKNKTTTHILPF
ncbi:hypothetical protein H311_02400 [Anncaliia algerae PRA109]|nr:hypothetical protein H311_02400 [Anncaliia algerae PRA109]